MKDWHSLLFSDEFPFQEKAEQVFRYQYKNNPVYRRYCRALGISPDSLSHGGISEAEAEEMGMPEELRNTTPGYPLLPIKAFKDAAVTCYPEENSELEFKSSGTSDMQRSIHRIHDVELYRQSLLKGFQQFNELEDAVVWGYTPGYDDNPHSSLIYMIQTLLEQDESGLSRFLPLDEPLKQEEIDEVRQSGKRLILFGAAFGLLDLLEVESPKLPSNSTVIETGGMKTHRREISRSRLHKQLSSGFGLDGSRIRSEYGMAELLSQAYTTGGRWFKTVPWMQVSIRDPENPDETLPPYQEGLIGVIDLVNVHSCSFLLTGDRGLMDKNGRFQVLGRWNPKDLRGCNFLLEED